MMDLAVMETTDLDALPDALAFLEAHGVSPAQLPGMVWTGRIGGAVACVGGVVGVRPGVGELWLALSDLGRAHPAAVARTVCWLCDQLREEYPTLQARFDLNDPTLARWAGFLWKHADVVPVTRED